jgi:hypothetical protein
LQAATRYADGMNAVPPNFPPASSLAQGAVCMKWAALQEAGAVVCALAGEEPEKSSAEVRNFPAMIRDAEGWRRAFAEKGVEDLAALMEPGISALLAVNARGVDATHAARALWREFLAARAALLAVVPPSGSMGPLRKA